MSLHACTGILLVKPNHSIHCDTIASAIVLGGRGVIGFKIPITCEKMLLLRSSFSWVPCISPWVKIYSIISRVCLEKVTHKCRHVISTRHWWCCRFRLEFDGGCSQRRSANRCHLAFSVRVIDVHVTRQIWPSHLDITMTTEIGRCTNGSVKSAMHVYSIWRTRVRDERLTWFRERAAHACGSCLQNSLAG